jgi:hypothetical protein
MMDITRKLELLANLQFGQIVPPEIGINSISTDMQKLCAEALAEINKLRTHERERGVYFINAPDNWTAQSLPSSLPPYTPSTISEREQAEKTLVEAWGSPFAMNTENWK